MRGFLTSHLRVSSGTVEGKCGQRKVSTLAPALPPLDCPKDVMAAHWGVRRNTNLNKYRDGAACGSRKTAAGDLYHGYRSKPRAHRHLRRCQLPRRFLSAYRQKQTRNNPRSALSRDYGVAICFVRSSCAQRTRMARDLKKCQPNRSERKKLHPFDFFFSGGHGPLADRSQKALDLTASK